MKYLLICFTFVMCFCNSFSQEQSIKKNSIKTTLTYTRKKTDTLKMDLYTNDPQNIERKPCILFVFGGGFFMGRRDDTLFANYFQKLAENNFLVVSIDYRLGLKDQKWPTAFHTIQLKNAIDTAVADLYDATAFLLKHADSLHIDTSKIILSGSSAGAITVLQADWHRRNRLPISNVLPKQFDYAGVIAFAGAIFSYTGKPAYKLPPAPTMLFHGTDDYVVPFNKIRLLNRVFYGSKAIAKLFRKNNYPYYFQYEQGMGHEVAGTPMYNNIDDILWFIDRYIYKHKKYLIERNVNDLQRKRTFFIPAPEEQIR